VSDVGEKTKKLKMKYSEAVAEWQSSWSGWDLGKKEKSVIFLCEASC
jgi:hypothetical protein